MSSNNTNIYTIIGKNIKKYRKKKVGLKDN